MSTVDSSGLPYCINLATGYPYMLTTNVDTEDGLANGAVGVLRFIEPLQSNGNDDSQINARLWLEFQGERTGAKACVKFRPLVASRNASIDEKWTPIQVRSANITLGGSVKCKRNQFPLAEACAITIHKSQGGTFNQVVVEYDKSQLNQLVYVALSRVTDIEGLFLTNPKNDFKFYHAQGSLAPSVKEVRDEYLRLNQHPLPTLSSKVKTFLQSAEVDLSAIIVCTINAQSLVAHHNDIESDKILTKSDILAITETWMNTNSPVVIDGFELVTSSNNSLAQSSSYCQEVVEPRRIAGGVAIYRKLSSSVRCNRIDMHTHGEWQIDDSGTGDASIVVVCIENEQRFLLATVYIHPGKSKAEIENFLLATFQRYTEFARGISSLADAETPFMITGDFNFNIADDRWLIEFFSSQFGFIYSPSC